MKIKFLLFLLTGYTLAGASTEPPRAADVEAAAATLGSSDDIIDLANALKIVSASPVSRQLAIKFLDGPSRFNQVWNTWFKKNAGLADEILDNGPRWAQWQTENPEEFNTDWTRFLDALYSTHVDLSIYFARNGDPGTFEVFKHYTQTRVMNGFWGGARDFATALNSGSELERPFLDFMEGKIYAPKVRNPISDSIDVEYLTTIYVVNDSAAFERIRKILLSGGLADFDFNVFIRSELLRERRYDTQIVPLFIAALSRTAVRDEAVHSLFRFRFATEGHGPPQLVDADVSAYPLLLAFINRAQTYGLSIENAGLLRDAKAAILKLYSDRNIFPPSDAELADIAEGALLTSGFGSANSTPNKRNLNLPVSSVPQSPISTSTPLLIVVGLAGLIGFIFVFRRR